MTARPSSATTRPSSATTRPSSATTRPSSATARPSSATARPSSATTRPGQVEPLARELLAVVAVLVVGSLMVVLDTTILTVAVGELSGQFRAPLPAVQWAVTGYTLALATSIPLTAWAVGRWGATRVYLAAVLLFVVGSGLAGAA
ncbi:MAG: hypothetical protein ACRCY8_15075 [Dermatophilaceae bacterium]